MVPLAQATVIGVIIHTTSAPWTQTLSSSEYLLVLYFLVAAGLALFGGFIRTIVTRKEIGSRYRPATAARLGVAASAALSYAFIIVTFTTAYTRTSAGYVPTSNAILTLAARYMDWSVTVPLLTVELLAVCMLSGAAARRAQTIAMAGAFLMIFTGYIGAFVAGGGGDTGQLVLWGVISSAFWIITTVVLVRAVKRSLPALTLESAVLLRNGTALLLSGWVVYPLVYIVQIVFSGGQWTTVIHIALCITDVVVKVGFGGVIHRVAQLRTAEDVRAGMDVHSESIWISSVKQSDAGVAREVYLAIDAAGHVRRPKPPTNTAVAVEQLDDDLP